MTEAISAIVWPVLGAVLTASAGVIAPIAVKLLLAQLKKIHITVSAERQGQLEYLAKQAVLRTAELAANKKKVTGVVTSGPDMLQIATVDIMAKSDATPKEAADTIHAVLPQVGLGALVSETKKADIAKVAAVLAAEKSADSVIPFAPKAAGGQ